MTLRDRLRALHPIFQLHWLLGITAGSVLVVVGVTGGLMSFQQDILEWLNPATVERLRADTPRLSPPELVARYHEAHPEHRVSSLFWRQDRPYPMLIGYDTPESTDQRGGRALLDPYTAEPMAQPRGQWTFGLIRQLHERLAAGRTGQIIVGIATITLDRPEHFNAIAHKMPREIRAAVELAEADHDVHVIIVRGAGPGFCAGYDLKHYAERKGAISGSQDMPWDPTLDFQMMWRNTQDFMALWRATKPTIARVHGAAVAGGSDIALCCDFLIMAEDGGRPVAGALNLAGRGTLFGRNWGSEADYKFLHFEACYYQAIDYAIAHGLKWVEAGAQGPHKVQRGYLPQQTYSAHWIADKGFRDAVSDFLDDEARGISREMSAYGRFSPFKKGD